MRPGDPGGGRAQEPPPGAGQAGPSQQQTEQFGAANPNPPRPSYPPPPPVPPAPPTDRLRAPDAEPAPAKKKRRLRDPLSILLVLIIVISLLVAGLIGAELYVRNRANNKVAAAVACEVKDKATAQFGVAPLVLWQVATQHYTNISVQTAGNQIRDAKGMQIKLTIDNVQLKSTPNSKGTIGALNADITWTSEGIKESVQNAIPILGPFVTNSVVTSPADGTIELKGMLNDIKAKPVVSGNGLQLQIIDFNTLGFTLPKETVQSTLDEFTSNLTKNYPLGIHADNVQVTSTGVQSHFSTQNATIPAGGTTDPCFANV
jgi:uncharacterized membrane protein